MILIVVLSIFSVNLFLLWDLFFVCSQKSEKGEVIETECVSVKGKGKGKGKSMQAARKNSNAKEPDDKDAKVLEVWVKHLLGIKIEFLFLQ